MSEVLDGSERFAQRRIDEQRRANEQMIRDQWEQITERRAKHMEDNKCCATLETGSHPEDDFHLCLRTKDHKGYHMDKITGLNWKWSDT